MSVREAALVVVENARVRPGGCYEVSWREMMKLAQALEEEMGNRYISVRAYKDEEFGEHLVVDLEHPKGPRKYLMEGEPEHFATVVQSGLTADHAHLLARALNAKE